MLTALAYARSRLPLARRADAVELLDSGILDTSEVEANLADLARLNRLPGGTRASIRGIRRLAGGRDAALRILDVGTGSGDLPLAFAHHGWSTLALDLNRAVLDVARRRTAGEPLVEIAEGDARRLPFEDRTFDVAHCSLLLHHLDPSEAADALRELRRVAKLGVVINDLRRGIWPLCATVATSAAIGRSRVTRHDGLASARRAYTLEERDELLHSAGLATRWHSSRWMPRVVTTASPA
ncbi:MAG TPA: methyltransferase domain-containing protein [Candidatus Binatia bacterium]|nr:methyltransferase domain-containing protein [Candidatus Binatia bacterium]